MDLDRPQPGTAACTEDSAPSWTIESLRAAARAGEILKDSPLRRVYRVRLGDSIVVLKEARIRGAWERVRALWLRSRVRVEFRNLREARARGLPCPQPLGYVIEQALSPRTGFVVLEDLGQGSSVDRIMALPSVHRSARTDLMAACGALLARALDAGLDQRDLHLGNVWRRDDGALFLLDLHAARLHDRPVRLDGAQTRTLALSLPWPEDSEARETLFRSLGCTVTPGQLARWRRKHLDRRLRRALRPSGDFRALRDEASRGPETWARIRRRLEGRALDWSSAEICARLAAGTTIKDGRRGRVVRASIDDVDVVAKSRPEARAIELWISAEALALRRLPHAPALACLRVADRHEADRYEADRNEGDRHEAEARWIVSRQVDGVDPSRDHARQLEGSANEIAVDFGRFLGRLHATGWRCRDPRLDNFVVVGGRHLALVDLDGVAPLPRLRRRSAMAGDLGRALAWLRHQSPGWVRDRAAVLAGRAYVGWLRERRRLESDANFVADVASRRRFLGTIELRCEKWQSRHPRITNDPEVVGSDSGGESSQSR